MNELIAVVEDEPDLQQIVDFIPQHHGTRVLAYFYHKAKAQAEAEGKTVDISDFRYPGPKPQSREAAILMLADGSEAAVRSLEEPTPENISAIVHKIVDSVIADGQLDECDITFREIATVRDTLISTLEGVYHHRISYPGFNPPNETRDDGEPATRSTSELINATHVARDQQNPPQAIAHGRR